MLNRFFDRCRPAAIAALQVAMVLFGKAVSALGVLIIILTGASVIETFDANSFDYSADRIYVIAAIIFLMVGEFVRRVGKWTTRIANRLR